MRTERKGREEEEEEKEENFNQFVGGRKWAGGTLFGKWEKIAGETWVLAKIKHTCKKQLFQKVKNTKMQNWFEIVPFNEAL